VITFLTSLSQSFAGDDPLITELRAVLADIGDE
jgi:hypothetical protein